MIVIGDSHTFMFKDYCETVHINNPTAHNIHKHKKLIDNSLINDVNLFSFGEIDCRIHFWYQHKKTGIPLITLMKNTVDRYLNFVIKRFNCYILSVPPAGTQENRFNYPYYASYVKRKYIYFAFNLILEEHCSYFDIPFINYYYDALDWKMERKIELIADEVHLNNKIVPLIMEKANEKRKYKNC